MPPDNDNTIAINSQCYSTMTINVCNYAFIVKVDTGWITRKTSYPLCNYVWW